MAGLAMSCAEKPPEADAVEEISIAEPHASLGAAANVIGGPAADTSSPPAAPKE